MEDSAGPPCKTMNKREQSLHHNNRQKNTTEGLTCGTGNKTGNEYGIQVTITNDMYKCMSSLFNCIFNTLPHVTRHCSITPDFFRSSQKESRLRPLVNISAII